MPAKGPQLLQGRTDRFKRITIQITRTEHPSDEEFERRLIASLAHWRETGVQGVWMHVKEEHTSSSLISICLKHEFVFAKEHRPGYVIIMNQWFPTDEIDQLPESANQQLDVPNDKTNDHRQALKVVGYVVAAGVGAIALPLAATAGLAAAGFTASGVLAGSIAAGLQSTIGNVAAGSLFAAAQSAGAAGFASTTVAGLSAAGSAISVGVVKGIRHLRSLSGRDQ